ncbi:metal-dependent transcriptional regulator [Macrococcoides canis]|uniref:Manganese transport regulator n=1 Tax=Macrococcoides canis TaxID=1855823 RepID=A0A6G7EV13_9STAP|nr:metal-dependent transcriptional regulator [Macrococcus canis]QCT73811.1 metal-dependent transcriptional regulator [Macrococcus canis]QIH77228.1 MarR family transcriptional regulator [Macrococcus canis]QNR06842.1 MarR family transcriptional regulator [Macrococcus canis]QUR94501.1 MarR family transcriptional regulator [Macrococcus canis]UTH06982.1 metal-dependent transcriptional regulator [Macrococcus canis]
MLTEEKEDYLKCIYHSNGINEYVSNKKISTHLGIKPPSVTEMTNRLEKEGYIRIKPYKGAMLTEIGVKEVARVVKRHRLIECFLIESLGYRWDEVHIEAEVLEHRVSDLFIERLDKMLQYPKYCPHGALIPRGDLQEESLSSITELSVGDTFILAKVVDEVPLLSYLYENDIKINDSLIITSIDEANQIMHLSKEDKSFSLSMKNAEKLFFK